MLVRELRPPPRPWNELGPSITKRWTFPFHAIEWSFDWLAYWLSRWAFLEVLEYLGALSVLFGVLFYISEAGDRRQQKHYQAWQVINTAQGKGGSGGRIEALEELNADGVPLVGVDVAEAFLQGVRLAHAHLARADFQAADGRDSVFTGSDLSSANLQFANFRNGNLERVNLDHADLQHADLVGATLSGANLTAANLKNADLRNCDLAGTAWRNIASIEAANIFQVRNAPAGFIEWARLHGAVSEPGHE